MLCRANGIATGLFDQRFSWRSTRAVELTDAGDRLAADSRSADQSRAAWRRALPGRQYRGAELPENVSRLWRDPAASDDSGLPALPRRSAGPDGDQGIFDRTDRQSVGEGTRGSESVDSGGG